MFGDFSFYNGGGGGGVWSPMPPPLFQSAEEFFAAAAESASAFFDESFDMDMGLFCMNVSVKRRKLQYNLGSYYCQQLVPTFLQFPACLQSYYWQPEGLLTHC